MGRFWAIFRVTQTYSPVELPDFRDFWYVGPLGGVLVTFIWIFQNFDFFGLGGSKRVDFGSFLGSHRPTARQDCSIFVIFGMWDPWARFQLPVLGFFKILIFWVWRVEKGRFWVNFRVAWTYSPVGWLDFRDFWYLGLLGEVLGVFLWIFQNFDFWGRKGRKWVDFGPFLGSHRPTARQNCPIFVIFGMWDPWAGFQLLLFGFFKISIFLGQEGRKGSILGHFQGRTDLQPVRIARSS